MGNPVERGQVTTKAPAGRLFLTSAQLVEHLKSRGVTFTPCSEADAARYLDNDNNYLRTASYRKLYPRQLEGGHVGDYVNLDFGSLVALSSLDRQLRETFLAISVDVEHFARVKVLRRAVAEGENGYDIVRDFYASLNHKREHSIKGDLARRSRDDEDRDAYAGDLIAHYRDDMPVWVLMEVVEFGTLLTFYKFCAERWDDTEMEQEHYVLKSVKALRNATAHNHCVINGFAAGAPAPDYHTNALITRALNAAGVRRTKSRRAKLANLRVAQMAATLYALDAICTGRDTVARHAGRLAALRARYEELLPKIRPTNSLVSFFEFLWRLVDIWAPQRA